MDDNTDLKLPTVMIVRDYPSKPEDFSSKHVNAAERAMLLKAISNTDLPASNWYITYLNKCPALKMPDAKHRKACAPFLYEEIAAVQPKIIVTMGDAVTKHFFNSTGSVKWRGRGRKAEGIEPYLITTHALSYVVKQPWRLGELLTDFNIAARYVLTKHERPFKDGKNVQKNAVSQCLGALSESDTDTVIAFDIETDSEENAIDPQARGSQPWLLTLSFLHSTGAQEHFLFDHQAWLEGHWDTVGKALAVCPAQLVAQNGKFDLQWLRTHCLEWDDVELTYDTAITHHILNENATSQHSLSALEWRYLPQLAGHKDAVDFTKEFCHQMDQPTLEEYAVSDTLSTALLHAEHLQPKLKESDALARQQAKASSILATTEAEGCRIDTKELARQLGNLGEETALLHDTVVDLAVDLGMIDFNPNSPTQMMTMLYRKLGLPEYRNEHDKVSTDSDALLVLEADPMTRRVEGAYSFITMMQRYRKVSKLHQMLEGIKEKMVERGGHHYIRTSYMMYFVVTGRMSSRNPNLQNVPKKGHIKQCFVPHPGNVFVDADYSQAEYRVMAHLAQDTKMQAMLRDGHDFHSAMQEELLAMGARLDGDTPEEIRTKTKNCNFAVLYGVGDIKLAAMLKLPVSEVKNIKRMQREAYPILFGFVDSIPARARENGNTITSPFGRKRRVPYLNARARWWRFRGQRQIINSVAQGGASDLTLHAMVECMDVLKKHGIPAKVRLTVHDSITFEVPEEEGEWAGKLVKSTMEHPDLTMYGIDRFFVPLVADVEIKKESWG